MITVIFHTAEHRGDHAADTAVTFNFSDDIKLADVVAKAESLRTVAGRRARIEILPVAIAGAE